MILLQDLSIHYRVDTRKPGFSAAVRSLFRKQYRRVIAVDHLSFEIDEGEIVAFLGPNGAGKTTALKSMAGLLYPTSGMVNVGGYTPHKREPEFLGLISLVMGQKQQLMWDLPASESFLVNKAFYGIKSKDYRRRLEHLTDLLELGDILTKPVRKLSLGERMKCEFALSLLHQPRVLFLDEPTIGLDVTMQENVRQFVRNYNREQGATIILTSHYMGDITALATRVLVIDQGRLTFNGSLTELVNRVADKKVLHLQFREVVPSTRLISFGFIEECRGREARIRVDRACVASIVATILEQFDVEDISIEEVDVGQVIRSLYNRPYQSNGKENGVC